MGLFKSKEDKDAQKEKKINELLERRGLQNFPEEYREILKYTLGQENGVTLMDLAPGKNEKTYLDLIASRLSIIEEQNWMIIKLLHDISQKF